MNAFHVIAWIIFWCYLVWGVLYKLPKELLWTGTPVRNRAKTTSWYYSLVVFIVLIILGGM